MTPNEIRAALMLRSIRQKGIAEETDTSESEVSMCISGRGRYSKIREAIARNLEKDLAEVFDQHHPKPQNRENGSFSQSVDK